MALISPNFLIILISVGAVALLVLGYSITYFFRGRHVQTDVGDNDEMKKLGLKCTSQQIREDEAALRGVPSPGYFSDCASCATPCPDKK
jgi:hypothetical protein